MAKTIDLQIQITHATNFESRLKGLLFQKKAITKEGLLLTPCNSVHMFFMRFPIDVVFLNQTNKVVKVVSDLKPWRIVPPVSGAHSALELPVGTILERDICVGDWIEI
ncbi:DUF192 domain-containing protein [Paenisporosarcina quisquiliarum]|uniref:DUF192 domain-containing protein n=1 Tax=Paenisporosarcina quisquiliarum TaxID=365346 RepID=A0A9X3LHS9_9BACL|nr:DUF192 domain-containing protein [Paenisporosarcina quisquiliarum]